MRISKSTSLRHLYPVAKSGLLLLMIMSTVVAQDKSNANLSAASDADKTAISSKLERIIKPLVTAHAGDVAVAIRHLETGEHYEYRADQPQATASLIKFPIMIEAYRQAEEGKIDLNRKVELKADDRVPGSGILTKHFSPGVQLSVRDAIRLMIAFSDNTATNLVLDQITIPATGGTMRQWGFAETQVHSKVFRRDLSIDTKRSERYGLGSTTASDMVALLAQLHAGKLVSPNACKAMLEHLATCDDTQKFPAMLPAGTKLYHKTGSVDKVRTDAGIMETPGGPVALCVLTENNRDTSWTNDNAGDRLCAEIASATFVYFAKQRPKTDGSSKQPQMVELALGANGDLVQSLQRTLNLRSEPSPSLSVDGDYGPATENAVKAFQKSKKLEVTGIVDKSTWEALGTLVTEDAPVASPQEINSEKLIKKPADDPSLPPQVTCKAYAIADASTGKVLAHELGDKPLDIASTTKIMTAYVVIQYCQDHPEALKEMVTFSERADKTSGSTSGIRAGERVSVYELLYGLLLPSGNDASVALAEHFGARLAPENQNPGAADSYDKFIDAMNATAKKLEMKDSHYANPHGLTAEGHLSTCLDLIKLTRAARKLPLFCEITACRQRGCLLTSESGYQRNVKWENTNQLLPIEGYYGVKTGTTDAAGACLVSIGKRGDKEIIVVVLGSIASAARYSDTRNLFAWAWRQSN